MEGYVDYSKWPRRELQTLCKQHKILANKTNLFMAESLDALLNNAPRQNHEEFQEDEVPAPDSPEVEKIVEKVRGKRESKKALLPEPELDLLTGMLASSTLTCNFQSEITEPAEIVEDQRIISDLPVAKGRRGRPRATKKEEKITGRMDAVIEDPVNKEKLKEAELEPEGKEVPNVRAYVRKIKKVPSKAAATAVEPEEVVGTFEPEVAELMVGQVEDEEEGEEVSSPAVKEEVKAWKLKQAVAKSRPNAAVDDGMEQVVPELKSSSLVTEAAGELTDEVGENQYAGISPPSTFEQDLLSVVAVKESKPKARRAKKTGTKSCKVVGAPLIVEEDARESGTDEPIVSEKVKYYVVPSDAETEYSSSTVEVQQEVSEEPHCTPMKKAASNLNQDKENELQSLSIRELVKACKEKGLKTRGTTRSIQL